MNSIRWLPPLVPTVSSDAVEGEAGSTLFFPIPKDWTKPNLFTEKIVTSIIKDVELGLSLEDASVRQCLKEHTARNWYDSNHGNFRNIIDRARIDNKRLHIARLVKAETGNQLKSSAWWLERKHKTEFGRETTTNLKPIMPDEKQYFRIGGKEIAF